MGPKLAPRQLEPVAELQAGERVGRYTILSRLGEGGMAIVYRATAGDEEVALKFVRREHADDRVFRKRFDREARTATRVEHPHLVPVLETGEHNGVPYMAQQFIRGGSLQERLEREGPMQLEDAVVLCLQVAKGLGALHAERLIHRDLKPANILLDTAGQAYVSDFGLAKDPDASALTKPGHVVGSVDYMSPEQIRGEEVTAASDVYALGCVTFECLAGRPPFADREGIQVLWAHLRDEPPSPRDCRHEVPEDVCWVVARALEKEPERRPATATAYARMVQVAAGVPPLSPGEDRR